MIHADRVELATEAFGDPCDPPILLIMGIMASMLWWPKEFCERLAARGRYVIRYDQRDTGLSTTYEAGKPPYAGGDLVDDAIRIVDGYGLEAAHLVGMSAGGAIGQLLALQCPERVLSLTAISTSPVGVDTSSLPGPTEVYKEHCAAGEKVDWSNEAEVIEYVIKDTRMLAGTAHPYDEVAARELVERDAARARNYVSAANHFMLKDRESRVDGLRALVPPLLVIHGASDPLFPVEHSAALAAEVEGAKLVRLEGGGHEVHPSDWDEIIGAIVAHTGKRPVGGTTSNQCGR